MQASDFKSADLGTMARPQFDRLSAAAYPGAVATVIEADGSVYRWTSVNGTWLASTGLTRAQVDAGATSLAGVTSGGSQLGPTASPVSEALEQWAGNLDALIVGAITRDSNGAATSAGVVWPDGATGTYTATTVSSAFPGAVDAYTITHILGGVTLTATQPAVTRDASGAVVTRPAITVA